MPSKHLTGFPITIDDADVTNSKIRQNGVYVDLVDALASAALVDLTTEATGTLQAAQEPAHTGDVTNSAGSLALTIAANAVTNAKAAQMAANTLKGNNTGATANAADLTVAQVKTLLSIEICVKDPAYAAVGDGVANDTAAFVAAAATGKVFYVPPGDYLISSAVTLTNSMVGQSKSNTRIIVSGSAYDAFTLNADRAGIDNITITSASQRSSGAFVAVAAGKRSNYVRNALTSNGFTAVKVGNGAVITDIEDVEILDTTATTGVAIDIQGGSDTYITNVVVDASGTQPLAGLRVQSGSGIWVTDTDIIHAGTPVLINPGAGQTVTWLFFSGFAADTSSGSGIKVAPTASGSVRGLFVDNSWTATCDRGIHLDNTGGTIDGVFVSDTQILNNLKQGAYVVDADSVKFSTCTVAGNSGSSNGTYAGIEFVDNVTGWEVSHCRIGGAAGFAASHSYGILVGATNDNYSIASNDLRGNVTGPISNGSSSAATTSIRDNLGNTGDKSTVGPTSSVDSEIALFSGTTGDVLKRAAMTGVLKATSGVLAAATAGTDYPGLSSTNILSGFNTFTSTQGVQIESTDPNTKWKETDGGAEAKYWDLSISAEVMSMRCINDAFNSASTFMKVTRSGQTPTGISFGAPFGYDTGQGGTVTQATSKATAFTLSKPTGQITLNGAALAADTTVSATWTNTAIAATDVVVFNHVSGGTLGAYTFNAQCAAGSATLNIRNITPGSLSEAPVIQFNVIKGKTS
jgi:hypothetical protein